MGPQELLCLLKDADPLHARCCLLPVSFFASLLVLFLMSIPQYCTMLAKPIPSLLTTSSILSSRNLPDAMSLLFPHLRLSNRHNWSLSSLITASSLLIAFHTATTSLFRFNCGEPLTTSPIASFKTIRRKRCDHLDHGRDGLRWTSPLVLNVTNKHLKSSLQKAKVYCPSLDNFELNLLTCFGKVHDKSGCSLVHLVHIVTNTSPCLGMLSTRSFWSSAASCCGVSCYWPLFLPSLHHPCSQPFPPTNKCGQKRKWCLAEKRNAEC